VKIITIGCDHGGPHDAAHGRDDGAAGDMHDLALRNAELKALRAGLQARQLTLAELLALAQSDHTAERMAVRTALMALPGIRTARASQLMTQAGVGDACRTGSLTAGGAP
jgi:hypothetical protein